MTHPISPVSPPLLRAQLEFASLHSAGDEVEHSFKTELGRLFDIDFQGDCTFFLGVSLD